MAAQLRAPQFANSNQCSKCSIKFTVFKRKHHCRGCGSTCCQSCSSHSIPLPQFGYAEAVRVCQACFDLERKATPAAAPSNAPASAAAAATAALAPAPPGSAEASDEESADEEIQIQAAPLEAAVVECSCGMPLCICQPDPAAAAPQRASPAPRSAQPSQSQSSQPAQAQAQPRALLQSSFSGFGSHSTGSSAARGSANAWNLQAPVSALNAQAREAVKAKDLEGVQALLQAKASASVVDHNGYSLAHLAAMFNHTAMVEILVNSKADIWVKNPSGESAIDLAPPALAGRMVAWQPRPPTQE